MKTGQECIIGSCKNKTRVFMVNNFYKNKSKAELINNAQHMNRFAYSHFYNRVAILNSFLS